MSGVAALLDAVDRAGARLYAASDSVIIVGHVPTALVVRLSDNVPAITDALAPAGGGKARKTKARARGRTRAH